MAAYQLKPPAPMNFDCNVSEQWKSFKRAWELFALATQLDSKPEPVQVATFLTVCGPQAQRIFATLTFQDNEKDRLAPLIQKFDEYCEPRKNIIVNRYMFNARQQTPQESASEYITVLKSLLQNCDYPAALEDELLRDRLVCGIRNASLREKLLQTDNLTLKKVHHAITAVEVTGQQVKLLSQSQETVDAVAKHQTSNENCTACPYRHPKGQCPAKGKKCVKCQKKNHFAAKCRTPDAAQSKGDAAQSRKKPKGGKKTVQTVESETPKSSGASGGNCSGGDNARHEDFDIYAVQKVDELTETKDWMQNCFVENCTVQFKLDSGSQVNILPLKIVSKMPPRREMKDTQVVLKSYSKHRITPVGQIMLKCKTRVNKKFIRKALTFQVVDDDVCPILGLEACEALGD